MYQVIVWLMWILVFHPSSNFICAQPPNESRNHFSIIYELWSWIPITNSVKVFWLKNQLKWWIAVKGTRSAFNLSPEQLGITPVFVLYFTLTGNIKLSSFKDKPQTTSSWTGTDPLGFFPTINTDIYNVSCTSFSLISQGHNTLFLSSPLSKVILRKNHQSQD